MRPFSIARLAAAAAAVLVLSGCETVPEITYVAEGGCGIAQWSKTWVQANVKRMSWDGPCVNGLMQGRGTLVADLNSGRQRRYTGAMEKGFFNGEGDYLQDGGWRFSGNYIWNTFTGGSIFRADGRPAFVGSMLHNEKLNGVNLTYDNQRYGQGRLYLNDGSYLDDARFDGTAGPYNDSGSVDIKTGRGIIWATYFDEKGVLGFRMVAGRRYNDELSYTRARTAWLEGKSAELDREIAAANAAQSAQRSADNQAAIAALTAGAAAQGNRSDRLAAMNNSLNAQPAAGKPAAAAASAPTAVASAPAAAALGTPSTLRVEFSGSMAKCLKVVKPTSDPSVNISNTTADYREKMSRGAVVINTCPEYLTILYCPFEGGVDVMNGRTMERGCSAGVIGGDQSMGPSNGKIVGDRSKPLPDRYIWTDRRVYYTPQAFHACNARTEHARMQGGNYKVPKLAGYATCVPRTGGNPFSPTKGLVVINEG